MCLSAGLCVAENLELHKSIFLRCEYPKSHADCNKMDLAGVYSDLCMDEMPKHLGILTEAGKTIFSEGCNRWSNNIELLKRRSDQVRVLRSTISDERRKIFEAEFAGCVAVEKTVRSILAPTDFAEECYGQLLFRGEYTGPLNHVPLLLTLLRFYKIFLTPAMAVAMPLMAIILPYILIRFFFGMQMPVGTYVGILRKVYSGGAAGGGTDFISQIKYWTQTGWLVFNFAQSIWQPVAAAKHLYRLDETLQEQGAAVRELILRTYTLRDLLLEAGFKSAALPVAVNDVSDVRRAVATVLENPKSIQLLLHQLGEYELFYRLASSPDICIVNWISAKKPILRLHKTFDIRVQADKRVSFNLNLANTHAMLTGPNRGGKSTALRTIGRNVFLAHCFGCSIGAAATMTPLRWMQTSLRLQDIPGQQSLFEREVSSASLALQRLRTGKGLLLIDELFHSTNPPDAEIASRTFLNRLWTCKTTLSVISTHVFSLVEDAPNNILRLCCPATEDGDKVKYKYGLKHGICYVSSVLEILREKGVALKRGE